MPGSSPGRAPPVVTILPRTLSATPSPRSARSGSSRRRWSSSRTLDARRSRYSSVPKATTVTPSATVYQKVSRRRMVVMSRLHDVADAPHRVHQLMGVSGVDLLPQPVDDHIHDVGPGIEVIVPGIFGDEGAGHDPAGVPHEIFENGVLLRREIDPLA